MATLTRNLSKTELIQRILDMASSGVYRESILEALQPVATKTQIRAAIAQAKHFGLHSVASLRDSELGTYYEVDLAQFKTFQKALDASIACTSQDEMVQTIVQTCQTIRQMLLTVAIATIGFGTIGIYCVATHHETFGSILLACALSTSGVWFLQRSIVRKNTIKTQNHD